MSPSTDTDRSAQGYRPVGEMQSAGDGVACAPVVRFLLSVSHCPLGLGKVQVPSGPTLTVTWGLTRANPLGARSTSPKSITSDCNTSGSLVEPLFPSQDRVVHLNRPGADQDRSLHALRRYADIDVPRAAVQSLRPLVVGANGEAQAIETPCPRFLFGRRREDRRDATSSVLRSHGNVLQLRGVRQSQVCMPERLVMLPCHEVKAVPLVKAGEAENRCHAL